MLGSEPDFKLQKPLLVEVVEAAGGKVIFGTKFHPELMPIENSYRLILLGLGSAANYDRLLCRDISAYMKRHNVVGSSVGYVERVCESYHHVEVIQVFVGILIFQHLVNPLYR